MSNLINEYNAIYTLYDNIFPFQGQKNQQLIEPQTTNLIGNGNLQIDSNVDSISDFFNASTLTFVNINDIFSKTYNVLNYQTQKGFYVNITNKTTQTTQYSQLKIYSNNINIQQSTTYNLSLQGKLTNSTLIVFQEIYDSTNTLIQNQQLNLSEVLIMSDNTKIYSGSVIQPQNSSYIKFSFEIRIPQKSQGSQLLNNVQLENRNYWTSFQNPTNPQNLIITDIGEHFSLTNTGYFYIPTTKKQSYEQNLISIGKPFEQNSITLYFENQYQNLAVKVIDNTGQIVFEYHNITYDQLWNYFQLQYKQNGVGIDLKLFINNTKIFEQNIQSINLDYTNTQFQKVYIGHSYSGTTQVNQLNGFVSVVKGIGSYISDDELINIYNNKKIYSSTRSLVRSADINATLLGGLSPSEFATAIHNHDGRYRTKVESDNTYVFKHGDTVTGTLTVPTLQINDEYTKFVEGIGNSVKVQTNSGYIEIGPQNTDYQHFTTDRPKFYFSATAQFNGNIEGYGGTRTITGFNLSGNASTQSKLQTARTISLAGDVTGSTTFDGSQNVSITATVANDSHTHDTRYYTEAEADSRFVNVTGDTMTGNLTVNGNITTSGQLYPGITDAGHIQSSSVVKIANGTQQQGIYQLGLQVTDSWADADLNYQANSIYVKGNIKQNGIITGSLNGNASTQSKLQTARTISLAGDVTGSTTFDGSQNVSISATVANDSHSHSNATITSVDWSKLTNVPDPTITLSGDVTGQQTMTNLGSITITTTVANDSHTHDTRYYTESEADSRFVNVAGDTVTGQLTFSGNTIFNNTMNINSEIRVENSNPSVYIWNNQNGVQNLYFGENSSSGYGLHLYWDSSYTTYLKSRHQGVDTNVFHINTSNQDFVLDQPLISTYGENGGLYIGTNGSKPQISTVNGNQMVVRTNEIRFSDSTSWDYDLWAGIKYDSINKKMYIGGPNSSYFTSNINPQNLDVEFDGINDVKINGTLTIQGFSIQYNQSDESFDFIFIG